MKRLERFCTFQADFPDDTVWSDDGVPIDGPGKALSNHICDELRRTGVVAGPIQQQDFYGWTFSVRTPEGDCNCIVQRPDDHWLLIAIKEVGVLANFGARKGRNIATLDACVAALDRLMANDASFSNVVWMSRTDYEKPTNRI